jgi:type IV pilus assembly protein PilB
VNIVTIENPIEYEMKGVSQVEVNEKQGLSFAGALRSILRQDPDVILIGEIRDRETALISMEAALTGHLVLSTLHTNDAPSAITRLIEMGVEPYLVASALDCVVAQRLARRLCEHCKQVYQPSELELQQAGFPDQGEAIEKLYRPEGCSRCGKTGYRGRFGLYEVMNTTEEIELMTAERRSSDDIRRLAIEQGMVTLRQDGLVKAQEGMTSLEEIFRVVV